MEFYNVKLLPKGLPEIIAAFVPYDIYPETKVIACPRKERRGVLGSAGYGDVAESYYIILYPTMIVFHWQGSMGTYSFRLWMDFLQVALHEIGHLATRHLYRDLPHDTETHFDSYLYVEDLANRWRDQALARILQVDPRLGQPWGFITGYPGIKAHQWRKLMPTVDLGRLEEFRGFRCGGQVTSGSVAKHSIYNILGGEAIWNLDDKSKAQLRRVARAQVYRAANNLGIQRYAFSTNGRRYLMFNAGEAEAVYEQLIDNRRVLIDSYRILKQVAEAPQHWKWELVDGNWELVGIDAPEKVLPEQMRLPF